MAIHTLTFRKAAEADKPFLLRLREATMRDYLKQSGLPFDEAAQIARSMDRFEHAQIVMQDGHDIGLLKNDKSTNPWELVQIQLLPAYQRKGIGETLLRQTLAEASKAKVAVLLSVLKVNPAKRLYERVGFREIGEKDGIRFLMQGP